MQRIPNMANTNPSAQRESVSALLGQVILHCAAVIHSEIELVIQGIREKVVAVDSGALTLLTGAVIICGAFLSLCAALIIGLSSYMAPILAAVVTGTALALIGVVIAVVGYRKLKKSILKP